ncbi:hypothetical protein [Gracilimonas mengyeensis]|uniref:Uncharacterized protein n=1 Tax=Gracilimonas mengyeensis TaxID=1302730 RepID=A0A521FB41_9BACT|nr:hypothetical protein [Gracilimonas mengyeensis]SMO93408.1 hypothetical protein SAMN06265219_11690 [Gracilimonas mengyeensis]
MTPPKKLLLNTFVLFGLIGLLSLSEARAQEVALSLEVSPVLENAQALSLTGLGISDPGRGPVLLSGYLENLEDRKLDNLYFEVLVNTSRYGLIAELRQRSGQPFSLEPFQSVYITNNDLANEVIPGVEEDIRFTGGLTPEGDEFINSLEGTTTLPQDIYTVEVSIFRVTNQRGRETLVTSSAQFGMVSGTETREIYLKSPGSVVGDGAEIINPYPQFSWEGETDRQYRILVVEGNHRSSPESLIESAISSASTNEGGSLLEFEHLDMMVQGNNFQYPASGAQALQPGETYYWRVLTTVQLSGATETLNSEIWEFVLQQAGEQAQKIPINEETEEAVAALLGGAQFQQMLEDGYELQEFEYDGQTYSGPAAVAKLQEILQKIRDEEMIIGND